MTYEYLEDAAYGQKLDFSAFIEEWLDTHEIYDISQQKRLIDFIYSVGWAFFYSELERYFESSELYELDACNRVKVLEY
jgi:dissimilatory sulfite reductase (desulfoviridin) alpha/beta subunit